MKRLSPANILFFIFVITVLLTRISLYVGGFLAENPDGMGLTIGNVRIHHYLYGLVLAPAGLLIGSIPLFAIGLGLFIDEATFLVFGGTTHADNYSWWSLAGTAVLIGLVFLLRKYLIVPFVQKDK